MGCILQVKERLVFIWKWKYEILTQTTLQNLIILMDFTYDFTAETFTEERKPRKFPPEY